MLAQLTLSTARIVLRYKAQRRTPGFATVPSLYAVLAQRRSAQLPPSARSMTASMSRANASEHSVAVIKQAPDDVATQEPLAGVVKPTKKRAAKRKSSQAQDLDADTAVVQNVGSPADASAGTDEVKPKTKKAAKRKSASYQQVGNENGADAATAADPEASADADAPAAAGKATKKKATPKRAKGSGLPEEPTGTRYEESMRPERLTTGAQTLVSWNVAGLRAVLKKDPEAFKKLVDLENVDMLCLQEIKLQDKHVVELTDQLGLDGWASHFNCSTDKLGYSGVAIVYRKDAFEEEPVITSGIGLSTHDGEGRVITAELADKFVVNTYVPNSGSELKRLEYRTEMWDVELAAYLGRLREKKPVVVTGDFNCAREPIDIHNAKRNVKSAGFTPEERASFQKVYMDDGWVDTFRKQHEGVHGYTYYGYRFNMRAKRKGWRLDYFLVSAGLTERCHDSFILPDFLGSDHCPLGLTIKAI